jgi:hypothetical protein
VCHEKAEPPVRKDAPKQSLGAIGRVIELRSERRRASEIRCPITAFGHDNIRVQVIPTCLARESYSVNYISKFIAAVAVIFYIRKIITSFE